MSRVNNKLSDKNSKTQNNKPHSSKTFFFIALTAAMLVAPLSIASLGKSAPQRIDSPSAHVVDSPSSDLPREWRWERKAMNFNHMYAVKN